MTCVMHARHRRPRNIKAGFMKERDSAEIIVHASPFVSLGDRHMVAEQLFTASKTYRSISKKRRAPPPLVSPPSINSPIKLASTAATSSMVREKSAPLHSRACASVHMDTGIGHEIEAELQVHGYPCSGSNIFPAIPTS